MQIAKRRNFGAVQKQFWETKPKTHVMLQNLLEGKRGIIFGALNDKSIAWKVAEKAKEQGAIFTLSNTPPAAWVRS